MAIDIRPSDTSNPAELRTIADTVAQTFLTPPLTDQTWSDGLLRSQQLRAIAAWDNDRCVGHVGAYVMDSVVPGGSFVPTIGVCGAVVSPTHSGSGIFRTMLERLHDDAQRDGFVLSQLRASESPIYGRFGYGMAGRCQAIEIDVARALPTTITAPEGRFELLTGPATDHVALLHGIHRSSLRTPGAVTRPTGYWRRWLADLTAEGHNALAVHLDPNDRPDGYVIYSGSWSDGSLANSTVTIAVHDICGLDDRTELALWQYILGVRLAKRITAERVAVDHVLPHMLADYRAVQTTSLWDDQWVRILDIDRALAARHWPDAAPIVLDVAPTAGDERRHNPATLSGRWHVSGAGVHRTDATADISTSLRGLSAAFLGDTSWHVLSISGDATAHTTGAIAAADALFGSKPGAFCDTFF